MHIESRQVWISVQFYTSSLPFSLSLEEVLPPVFRDKQEDRVTRESRETERGSLYQTQDSGATLRLEV